MLGCLYHHSKLKQKDLLHRLDKQHCRMVDTVDSFAFSHFAAVSHTSLSYLFIHVWLTGTHVILAQAFVIDEMT